MPIQRYLQILARRWPLLVIPPLVALMVGYLATPAGSYRAKSTLVVGAANGSPLIRSDELIGFAALVNTYAILASSLPIAQATIDQTKAPRSPAALAKETTAMSVPGTQLLVVYVTDQDSNVAQELANGIANALAARVNSTVQNRPSITGSLPGIPVYVYAKVPVPQHPISTGLAQNLTVAVLFGLLVGMAVVALLEFLNTSVQYRDDAERRVGAPVLGVVPDDGRGRHGHKSKRSRPELAAMLDPDAVRILRSNVLVALAGLSSPTVMVTSASEGEGKSTVCAALARSLSSAGLRVVVVDLDLRHPDAHRQLQLGAHSRFGVTDVVFERRGLVDSLQYLDTTDDPKLGPTGLYFLATGTGITSPTEMLGNARAPRMLQTLARHADIVLIDTPPVLPVADTLVVSRSADVAIIVVEAGKTGVATVREARDALTKSATPLLGLVLNKTDARWQDHPFGYGKIGDQESSPAPQGTTERV
ncbi:MAG: AAA family ATPase [Actinomycetota bacterium]|nr:AAA family ATPase [Actinomycetota bacterium]